MENFCIAAFRSRLHVMAFERAMKQQGMEAAVITTPRAVTLGCGLSVRFAPQHLARARQLCRMMHQASLIGFYTVYREANGRVTVRPAPLERTAGAPL